MAAGGAMGRITWQDPHCPPAAAGAQSTTSKCPSISISALIPLSFPPPLLPLFFPSQIPLTLTLSLPISSAFLEHYLSRLFQCSVIH
ncbi:uncharacterized protein BO72DRAFT_449541 [Aspergillus fijiensis CBS 313.89]|uniref:Uncharacterized protein n=1 Tax=Aspergillus fijiensis CBS 313.89 TaxID=1448319 RepID=A0A8G1RP98_9EURO|nr:uncharacterized protein BO72DRAFT_449541 [Aspergillus fijiensis CBS 313.89]RAK75818.1 hypothetical protein BO72DRAFT_449541 [Aspergillus fijiensis CBS 313.89]